MKKIKLIITGIFVLFVSFGLMAQNGPPDPPGDHGSDQDQQGGQAPIGSGVFILLGLGTAYGMKKVYLLKKTDNQ